MNASGLSAFVSHVMQLVSFLFVLAHCSSSSVVVHHCSHNSNKWVMTRIHLYLKTCSHISSQPSQRFFIYYYFLILSCVLRQPCNSVALSTRNHDISDSSRGQWSVDALPMAIFGWASVARELRKGIWKDQNELLSVDYQEKNIQTLFSLKLIAPRSQRKRRPAAELWSTATLTHAAAKTFHTGQLSGDTGKLDFF